MRAIHTVIYVILASSVLFLLYCGITGYFGPALVVVLILVVAECIVYASFKFKCPLSDVARKYGAEEENFSDLFIPRWLGRHSPIIFGSLFAIGLPLLALRLLHVIH